MHHPSLETKTIAPTELPPLISAIEKLMRQAERITQEAADEHLRAFAAQMREKFGADEIVLDEPYLPETLASSSLKFLIALERLMQAIERGAEDEDFRTAIFELDEPLMPQLSARLELETARHKLTAKQALDKTRQQAFGVKKYVWRAGSDSCEICAPLDGQIFTWEDGGEPGSTHPNCQCWAEPVLDEADQPKVQMAHLDKLAGFIALAKIIVKRAEKKRKAAERAAEAAKKPKPAPEKPSTTPKAKPKMNDTKTWPKPPKDGKLKEGPPSRTKPHSRDEKSLYDENGGEWRYAPEDKYHNEHWDYKPPGRDSQWENISIGDKPPIK